MDAPALTGRTAGSSQVDAWPQLDGLRGLAILGVLFHHFADFAGKTWPGWLGVELFFVLSGFLITRILLAERDRADDRRRTLVVFYARRALRIFPIYFLTLGILWAINFQQSRQLGWWLGTYTYNWYAGTVKFSGSYAHFWSLCVEEQFYLIWPLIALFCPRRFLAPTMIAFAAIGPIWRFACVAASTSRVPLIVMPFASFDCLAVGSLLAHFSNRSSADTVGARWFHWICKFGGIALMLAWACCMIRATPFRWHKIPLEAVFGNSAMALFFAWVVRRATNGYDDDFGKLLQMSWLRYVGRISYGIYVYHLFMPPIAGYVMERVHVITISHLWLSIALSLTAASWSWHLFEARINNLKRHFKYTPGTQRTTSESVSPVHTPRQWRWPLPIFRGP
ncbi:MAG TPA: acyltransferase [Gemmataceae bacterium]|jgi:peptidoglycan/LPS O-acetylase OafA/YrhL|nr:acyltransferase [Gemmataceae bacterium]